MTTAMVEAPTVPAQTLESVILQGDLSRLNAAQKLDYMHAVCKSLGLNPLTKPFAFLRLNGKEVMYALRDCTEQLRKIHRVSVTIAAREMVDDCYIVTARAEDGQHRHDESIGAVNVKGLSGENKANALMKAETKAKRRVTLSICGLGMLDETEADSIPGAATYEPPTVAAAKEALKPANEPRPLVPTASTATEAASAPTSSGGHDHDWDKKTGRCACGEYRNASFVPATGGPITPDQTKAIHALLGRVGNITDEAYRQQVAVYREADGSRCVDAMGNGTSKRLSRDQASHLIARLEAKATRQDARAAKGLDGVPPEPAPPTLGAVLDRHFPIGDEERLTEWLLDNFGVAHVQELDTDQCKTALALRLAFEQGDEAYDKAETTARAMGKIR